MTRPLNLILITSLLLTASAQGTRAQGGEPSREPVLRIESGMHTAPIRRISVDAANRFLVTASTDKTVRVWELATGRLLRVIRPPLGFGNEGMLYAVAISPDGKTIATSGWTGHEWGKRPSIYLFDRESGKLIRSLQGLPKVVTNLIYSKDGLYLAVAFGGNGRRISVNKSVEHPMLGVEEIGGNNGILIYNTTNYVQTAVDKGYDGDSYGADFDAANRLVTSSYDGYIRLYQLGSNGSLNLIIKKDLVSYANGPFNPITKKDPADGIRPYSVSFSPDSAKIAVGFDDSTQVNILSGNNLSYLFSPDIRGIDNGNLFSVAWSADGKTLYAGGKATTNGYRSIRVWTGEGYGSYHDIPAASNTITHIIALSDGSIAYCASDPLFSLIDAKSTRKLLALPTIADYRDSLTSFLVSDDGEVL